MRFGLWAPDADAVDLLLVGEGSSAARGVPMQSTAGGWFSVSTAAAAGTLYRYRVDGTREVPDPASRFQPQGVHGPSEVVDPREYRWSDGAWAGRAWEEAVLYELHVGTFSAAGTFEAAAAHLPHLADLGVTAVEIMPVAAFAGERNWGYDGVLPFAPAASYGTPAQLKALVDAAHAQGIMVLLDVVYNHFGPEGNYLHWYAADFFTERHRTPWGKAMNFDGEGSRTVRDFFIHNALYWLEEFHLDGLRFDAVHAIADDSKPDILEELAGAVAAGPGRDRPVHLVLENDRNEAHYLRPREGRRGASRRYAAQWNDDFHHACHTLLTGEADGYYADYADRPLAHLGRCLAEGFAYQGEISRFRGGTRRGERCDGVPLTAFIAFLQNHDQVGNRARGERLTMLVDAQPLRVAVSLVLLGPAVPALFMGEEFGCRQPFLYFADFRGELRDAVRTGRRAEFSTFAHFGAAAIPDPMAEETFLRSKLAWESLDSSEHAAWLEYYRKLLELRRRFIVPRLPGAAAAAAKRIGASGLSNVWRMRDGARLQLLANCGAESVTLAPDDRPSGRLLHAEPAAAAESAAHLPPWSARWHLEADDAGFACGGSAAGSAPGFGRRAE